MESICQSLGGREVCPGLTRQVFMNQQVSDCELQRNLKTLAAKKRKIKLAKKNLRQMCGTNQSSERKEGRGLRVGRMPVRVGAFGKNADLMIETEEQFGRLSNGSQRSKKKKGTPQTTKKSRDSSIVRVDGKGKGVSVINKDQRQRNLTPLNLAALSKDSSYYQQKLSSDLLRSTKSTREPSGLQTARNEPQPIECSPYLYKGLTKAFKRMKMVEKQNEKKTLNLLGQHSKENMVKQVFNPEYKRQLSNFDYMKMTNNNRMSRDKMLQCDLGQSKLPSKRDMAGVHSHKIIIRLKVNRDLY